ncbi:MAG TPA: SDR family oxidoreductase [Rhizomicrobium sp.]|jgi:NAD(P)-dependent dehydrogenase (short-subunit alcohol dehydrogenase family)
MANVLITGANRGIGLELVRQYAADGARVFAGVRDPAKAAALSELARDAGGRISLHQLDVASTPSVEAFAKDVGDTAIDVLINNAGVSGSHQSLDDMNFDNWLDALNVMTLGPFRVSQAFLPHLEKAGAAKVMTVTSQIAASTWPHGGTYAYASAKAAVNRVMQVLAIDLKPRGVTVAVIHPGWVKTDMGGPNADITPEESACGIRKVIAGMTLADTGKFFKWNGDMHPW